MSEESIYSPDVAAILERVAAARCSGFVPNVAAIMARAYRAKAVRGRVLLDELEIEGNARTLDAVVRDLWRMPTPRKIRSLRDLALDAPTDRALANALTDAGWIILIRERFAAAISQRENRS